MNTTAYKSVRSRPVPSPFQMARKQSYNVQDSQHPVRISVRQLCGTYQITATFEEDKETLATFRHIPGLIAILCTLRQDGKIIGQGRVSSVVNRVNRVLERTLSVAINGSFLSAANSATKVLDTLRLEAPALTGPKGLGEASQTRENDGPEPASEKQCQYLTQLAQINCEGEELEKWLSQINSLTKEEASQAIAHFCQK